MRYNDRRTQNDGKSGSILHQKLTSYRYSNCSEKNPCLQEMSAFWTNSDLEYYTNVTMISDRWWQNWQNSGSKFYLATCTPSLVGLRVVNVHDLAARSHALPSADKPPPEVAQLTAIPHLWTLIFQNSEPNLLPTSSLRSLSRLPVVNNLWLYTLLFVFSFFVFFRTVLWPFTSRFSYHVYPLGLVCWPVFCHAVVNEYWLIDWLIDCTWQNSCLYCTACLVPYFS